MALIEEFEKTGNWLFKGRSFFPLLLYVFMAAIIGFQLDPFFQTFDLVSAVACIAISLFGQLIRALTIGYTPRGTSGRNTKDGQIAEVLNTKGMYSLVRHPLYLGNYFMWLGIMVYVGNVWFVMVCSLIYWLYYERIMFAEEAFLRGKFGQAYLDWSVGVPSAQPAVDGSGRPVLSAQRPEARVQRLLRHLREPGSHLGRQTRGARRRCLGGHPRPLLTIHAAHYVHRVLHTP